MSLESILSLPMHICETDEDWEKLKKKSSNQYDFYYPIGNCRPIDVTHGCQVNTPCDVMLFGCGDVRYLLHTLDVLYQRLKTKKSKPVLNFHLNDIEDGILCRDLIFLYLIDTIDPDDDTDLKFLWSVWNEVLLKKDQHERLLTVMKTLENVSSGDYGVYFGTDWTREKLVLDMKWFGKQKIRAQTIIEDRKSFFLESYNSTEFPEKPTIRVASRFTMQHPIFSDTCLTDRLRAEIQEYVEFGVTRINNGRRRRRDLERDFQGNQTFYRPRSDVWKAQDNCSPFMCYAVDYELDRYDGVNTTLATLFLEKLRSWVKTYQRIKKEGWDLKIFLWLGDCVDLCDGLPESLKFDFIHTSNLSDRIGIVPLLVHCQDRLKRENGLVTIESYQWARMTNTVENTLKFCVDIPLQMYPTVIGLHLVDDLHLGHERLLENGIFVGCGSLILVWKAARHPSPLKITGSDDVSKSLKGMVRLNTEQKDRAGVWGFQGIQVTKFDIEGRNKLIQRLRNIIVGGGHQIAKVIGDFLMGSIPESLKFLTDEKEEPCKEETVSNQIGQTTITEFIDRYEVTLTSEPGHMTGKFSCDYSDAQCRDVVVFTFTDEGGTRFSNTIRLSCFVSLPTSKIQLSRKSGKVSSVLLKETEFLNSERLMPREITSQKTIANLPDLPNTKFCRQLLSIYLFRMYPLQNNPPVTGRDDIPFEEQIHDLTAFLMETYMESRKKKKVFGIPTTTGGDHILGKWTAIFRVEGMKIWEEKPCLFVTWYDFGIARMLMLGRRVTLQEVADVANNLEPDVEFQEVHKFTNGYQTFGRMLQVNSARVKQDSPKADRWIWRTFIRPRYKYLTFDTFKSEVELNSKFGAFPSDPKDIKAHVQKLVSGNPLASKLNLGEKDLDEICKRAIKLTNPGYSGYGSSAYKSANTSSEPQTQPGTQAKDQFRQTSGEKTSGSEFPAVEKCDGCGKVCPEGKKCGGCKTVVYCNKDCQRQAWSKHKIVCKKKP